MDAGNNANNNFCTAEASFSQHISPDKLELLPFFNLNFRRYSYLQILISLALFLNSLTTDRCLTGDGDNHYCIYCILFLGGVTLTKWLKSLLRRLRHPNFVSNL